MRWKVVIVDDEKATWDIIEKLADWEKYNMEVVAHFFNGQEALDYLRDHPVDVLITDMNMPTMDGTRLLESLTAQYKDIQTIVISGYDDFKYVQHAIRSQSVDYLLKPVNPLELNKALEKAVLERKKSLFKKPLSFSDYGESIIPLLQEFKWRLFTAIEARDQTGLSQAFDELDQALKKYQDVTESVHGKLHYELIIYVEEQLYQHNLSLQFLELSHHSVELNLDNRITDTLSQMEEVFVVLLRYLMDFKQENSFLQITDVKEYIDRNYRNPAMTLRHIAEEFHVSKEYLSKAYKDKFAVNVTEYILKQRMNKAKQLMAKDNMKIKHAAAYVGYDDVSYFYRVWKKVFGFPPGELKKSKNGN
ncbi:MULTISPECIES: response regulator transcription factor [Gracilibacillus]|uniref:response regulator transcription factor n=1 Tax=Gracilibacillus TaxID=74385 RepID=UPI000825E49D|nr:MULTISPECIES: response regulator [Gracilibacillus]